MSLHRNYLHFRNLQGNWGITCIMFGTSLNPKWIKDPSFKLPPRGISILSVTAQRWVHMFWWELAVSNETVTPSSFFNWNWKNESNIVKSQNNLNPHKLGIFSLKTNMADLACVGKIRLSFGFIWFQAFSDRKRYLAAFLGLDQSACFEGSAFRWCGGTFEKSGVFFFFRGEGGSLWKVL